MEFGSIPTGSYWPDTSSLYVFPYCPSTVPAGKGRVEITFRPMRLSGDSRLASRAEMHAVRYLKESPSATESSKGHRTRQTTYLNTAITGRALLLKERKSDTPAGSEMPFTRNPVVFARGSSRAHHRRSYLCWTLRAEQRLSKIALTGRLRANWRGCQYVTLARSIKPADRPHGVHFYLPSIPPALTAGAELSANPKNWSRSRL